MQQTATNSPSIILTFIGSTPNIGTTITALATAVRIAERSKQAVGYLCLNLKSSKLHRYIGLDQPETTLDQLQADLRSYSLTTTKLQQAMYTPPSLPQLSLLIGNLSREQAEFYWPEHLEHLIEMAKKLFTVLIIDVSAYWDNAATITAMRLAHAKVMVTSGALSHFHEDRNRWLIDVAPLFQFTDHQFDYVLTKYPWKEGGYTMQQVQKQLQLKATDQLNISPALLAQLDQGTYIDWLLTDRQGMQLMKQGAKLLMKRHHITDDIYIANRQPWFRKMIMYRRNGVKMR